MTVIDYQCHWYPMAFYELVSGRDRYPRVEFIDGKWKIDADTGIGWSFTPEHLSIENYFARLDAAGIDVGVSSPNMVGDVTRLEVSEAREITRLGTLIYDKTGTVRWGALGRGDRAFLDGHDLARGSHERRVRQRAIWKRRAR